MEPGSARGRGGKTRGGGIDGHDGGVDATVCTEHGGTCGNVRRAPRLNRGLSVLAKLRLLRGEMAA